MAAVIHNEMLDEILAQVRPLIGKGKVADYIPALASVSFGGTGGIVFVAAMIAGMAATPPLRRQFDRLIPA